MEGESSCGRHALARLSTPGSCAVYARPELEVREGTTDEASKGEYSWCLRNIMEDTSLSHLRAKVGYAIIMAYIPSYSLLKSVTTRSGDAYVA